MNSLRICQHKILCHS